MKNLTVLIIGILIVHIGFSQTLTPEVYATSGDYFTNTANSLSWTLGECVIETYESVNYSLTQGFQQTNYSVTSIQENENENYSVIVYPNPASDFINICRKSDGAEKSRLDLLDMTGKIVYTASFEKDLQLNLLGYKDGAYLIRISDERSSLSYTYKLQKTK